MPASNIRKLTVVLILSFISLVSGCTSRTSAIATCSFEVEKQMQLWIEPNGTVVEPIAYERRKAELLWSCVESKGWIYDIARANEVYSAGKSLGLFRQVQDPKNWYWGWFGIFQTKSLQASP